MMTNKEEAIKDILTEFEGFADLILEQLDLLKSIINSDSTEIDVELRHTIKQNEKVFDQFDVKISKKIINTIVLYHPVASDLRKIMACYRMTNNLERIGDLIINIVNFYSKIKLPDLYHQLQGDISKMLEYSTDMVRKALLSFSNFDKEFIIQTIKEDQLVDDLNRKSLKEVIQKSDYKKEMQQTLFSYINIHTIMSNIERIADQATNIAEASVYAIEGKDISHKKI